MAEAAAPTPPAWRNPGAQPFLRLRDVVKDFGETRAVDHVSLDIFRGEFFALLGPSGCGKSTLLRMLAGFETPSAGAIELDGQDLGTVPPYERPVNMMFQSYALFPHMTVEKNIAFGLEQEKMPRGEIDARVREMLALTQLERFAARKPQQLSGGQRQRVALARALAKRPKLVLLDEPLGALDKKLREETQFELVNIQERLGLTFVIVTHDQEEAMTVASRIAVMRDGKISQLGEPRDIYEAPASRYVAEFIGDVNMIEAVAEEPAIGRFRARVCDAPISAGRAVDAQKGAAVAIALRPEKTVIELLDDSAAPEANSVDGVVEDIAYLGDMSIYRVKLKDGHIFKVARTNRARVQSQTITWDSPVRLSWDAQAVWVLKD